MEKPNWRKLWMSFVNTTRKKLQRKSKEPVSHIQAMSKSSELWPAEKKKIQRKYERELKKTQKNQKAVNIKAGKGLDKETA